jgi:hypothetical protein
MVYRVPDVRKRWNEAHARRSPREGIRESVAAIVSDSPP